MSREITIPGCLGEIRRWYSEYCSVDCRLAALCCLVVMCDFYSKEQSANSYFDLPSDPDNP